MTRPGLAIAARAATFALCLLLSAGADAAFAQPPITGPQDKACRDEAARKVFDAPDPGNRGLHAIGREIYGACMQRAQSLPPGRPPRRARSAA